MDIKKITESNRAAWNEALEYHQRARKDALQKGFESPDFTTLNRDCDGALVEKLNALGLSGKSVAQLPCNNGRELLSLMRLGASEAVGFDISDAAIAEARRLAEIAKLNAVFERADILEIGENYNGRFDFIYISEGSLQWFPDLNAYFAVVAKLLKRGGRILIFEIHPVAYVLESGDANVPVSYFHKGPYGYKKGLDYVGGAAYDPKECFWFMHKMPDILSAVHQSGIRIREFNEYNFEMANNEAAKPLAHFPLSYMLAGEKA